MSALLTLLSFTSGLCFLFALACWASDLLHNHHQGDHHQ